MAGRRTKAEADGLFSARAMVVDDGNFKSSPSFIEAVIYLILFTYVYIYIYIRICEIATRFFHKRRGASRCIEIGGVNAHGDGQTLHRSKLKKVMHSWNTIRTSHLDLRSFCGVAAGQQ